MDRGAWQATVCEIVRVRHNLVLSFLSSFLFLPFFLPSFLPPSLPSSCAEGVNTDNKVYAQFPPPHPMSDTDQEK